MVKHTETTPRQQPENCLSMFDSFVGLALKGLKAKFGDYPEMKLPDLFRLTYFLWTRCGNRSSNGSVNNLGTNTVPYSA